MLESQTSVITCKLRKAVVISAIALLASLAAPAQSPNNGKVVDGLERLLYVTDREGISVYDINDGHKLLRKIDVPETRTYYGIAASQQLGYLYVSSGLKDALRVES